MPLPAFDSSLLLKKCQYSLAFQIPPNVAWSTCLVWSPAIPFHAWMLLPPPCHGFMLAVSLLILFPTSRIPFHPLSICQNSTPPSRLRTNITSSVSYLLIFLRSVLLHKNSHPFIWVPTALGHSLTAHFTVLSFFSDRLNSSHKSLMPFIKITSSVKWNIWGHLDECCLVQSLVPWAIKAFEMWPVQSGRSPKYKTHTGFQTLGMKKKCNMSLIF